MTNWAGDLIALARKEQRLSQRELARRAHTSQAAIAAYESGKREPTVPTLQRIIQAAGLDLRMRLEVRDAHDEWLRTYESRLPSEVVEKVRRRDAELSERVAELSS
jgi:transcriptional regulator with XRE-family HTH domain